MLRHRHLVPEWMDADDVNPRELARALRFIRRINALLGYNANLVELLKRELATLPAGTTPTVLDVAAGSGDLLSALADRMKSEHRSVDLIGLDRHAATVAEGAAEAWTAGVRFIRADALALPFADASLDIVVSTLFIHHLPEDVAVAALAEMRRVARHTVIVADLIRSKRAYAWIVLFTLWTSRMIKHDARASVAHAFTVEEAKRLATSAGMSDAVFTTTFGHRFVLTWRRPT